MSEETIIRHCAPTLAGIKTGNLFRCAYPDRREMIEDVRRWNMVFSPKGLRLIPLQFRKGSAMIYLFRPSRLKADLSDHMACALLQAQGYCTETCSRCVACLIDRIRQSAEFPHEIGLFLGYPPEDVHGFMEHRDTGCKCVGFWKVYGDEKAARKTFDRYRKCSDAYYRQWKKGRSFDRLIIDTRAKKAAAAGDPLE